MDLNLRNLGCDNIGEGPDYEPNACSDWNSPSTSPETSASSSIGKNSDISERSSSDGENCEENEAQSSYKGPLKMMGALEEVLPMRRGISKFYKGKSKSFTSVGEAASVKEIGKPENAYTRKRRNLMAYNQVWDQKNNRSFNGLALRGNISKRQVRTTLAMAVAMTSSDSSTSTASDDSCQRSPPTHRRLLPPLHPNANTAIFCSSRSMSLADLQH